MPNATSSTPKLARIGVGVVAAALLFAGAVPAKHKSTEDPTAQASRSVIQGSGERAKQSLQILRQRGKSDAAAALILALRFQGSDNKQIVSTLQAITGHGAANWFEWMLWQQDHPEVRPHASFAAIRYETLTRIDPRFALFFRQGWRDPARMRIRLEEIVWGGVMAMDGIPSLDRPHMIEAAAAEYLRDDDLVFGVAIAGDERAYPLRIMGWHEMFNDVIGGVPLALAYCTLCGSGILFESHVAGRARPFVFGSSGLLYRSNKLMFDWETLSLWNQFTGEPVSGPLAASGIRLKIRPVAITNWRDWRAAHPKTRVLDLETGHRRDYGSGVVYKDYFSGPDLMFPVKVRGDSAIAQKDYVFAIRAFGAAKAWPLSAFAGGAVINDAIAEKNLVLIGDAATRTVRAYERGDLEFAAAINRRTLKGPGGSWRVSEDELIGPSGARLARVAGHIAYWFA